MMSAPRKHVLARAAAVVAAVAFACAGIGQLLHRSDKVHTLCAEHGEVLHLEQAAAGHHAAGALSTAPDAASDNGHEHCDLCPTSRETAAIPGHAPTQPARADQLLAPPIPDAPDRPTAIALYRTAPKASPPLPA